MKAEEALQEANTRDSEEAVSTVLASSQAFEPAGDIYSHRSSELPSQVR